MMTLPPRVKLIGFVFAAFVAGFLIGTFALTIPMPKVTSFTKNDLGFALRGTTKSGAAVMVFAEDGAMLAVTRADADGQFAFETISPATTTQDVILRAMNSGWRSSPPRHVIIANAVVETSSPAPSVTPLDEDLPPPGIPPTSTASKTNTASSTEEEEPMRTVESISAIASVANRSLKPKANQTLTVTVKDDKKEMLDGVIVTVVAHYPTEDKVYGFEEGTKGIYRSRFQVPENIGSGTVVILDVTARYGEFTSTASASFSIK
ncbi:MAG: Ig-like domain-containing protein [Patescibacteria group bacterium]|jgi:hypothetical protein